LAIRKANTELQAKRKQFCSSIVTSRHSLEIKPIYMIVGRIFN
jgi:hypothetical protein